jgi:ADP-ribosylglycohydrolase
MIGAIAGDIIGSVYEWNNIKTKKFELFSLDWCFTDDTVLTVALAESILTDKRLSFPGEGLLSALSRRRIRRLFPPMGASPRMPALQ